MAGRLAQEDAALASRAARAGVAATYHTLDGEQHTVSAQTLATVLEALGDPDLGPGNGQPIDGQNVLAPVRVSRRSSLPAGIEARLDPSGAMEVRWSLELETEAGGAMHDYGTATLEPGGRFRIACSWVPPTGYHRLMLVVETGNRRWQGDQRWIVVPNGCWPAQEALAGDLGMGVMAQLYSLRSDHNWGFGDLGDVTELCHRAAAAGADFVAISPLHAPMRHGGEVSPYAPSSRIFRNPLVIDVEAVPELAHCARTRAWLARDTVRQQLGRLRAADRVDYPGLARIKLQALRRLHRRFVRDHRGRDTRRGRAYARFRREQGPLLDSFAIFQTLLDLFFEVDGHADWRNWPAAYREARQSAVRAFAAEHAEAIDFHRFLQFETDRQLAAAQAAARATGLRIGLVHDLALGSCAGGFDTWAFAEIFARGVELGCPPDPLGPTGQTWGLPPIHPQRLEADGFDLYVRVLRSALAHGGGLRIDHILGLVRQFWVPRGSSGRDGAYVAMHDEALFGILALESRRARSLVVGEDLGTAPPEMDARLARWQVLSTRLVPFVREADGGFPPPAAHESRALLLATCHDLPTLAAWWQGADLDLRRRLELLSEQAWRQQREARNSDREALARRLGSEGLLPRGSAADARAVIAAVHGYMARAPARLVGVWLDDLASERRPANLPGVDPAIFPPWRRRLRASIRAIFKDPAAAAALAAASDRGC